MKILKAIGAFFVRIGRWIKETAWVQPLLIVGGIFAVIFSIPYIVDAVKSGYEAGNESEAYYQNYQLSLDKAEKKESEADKLFQYMKNHDDKSYVTEDMSKKYGEQFFVAFVKKGCEACSTVYPGFQKLEQEWNKTEFIPTAGNEFKLHTIFIDEITEDKLVGEETSFSRYFLDTYSDVFEQLTDTIEKTPYYTNMGGNSSAYATQLADLASLEKFNAPTTLMVDFKNDKGNELGICDVLFNFTGKDGKENETGWARTLIDCWNHTGEFEFKDQK